MTSIVKPLRPWKHPGASPASAASAAVTSPRTPLAERLRKAIVGLGDRRGLMAGARGAARSSRPAIDVAAAFGATDAELVRLSRWHARPSAEDIRWAVILTTRYGGVLRQR